MNPAQTPKNAGREGGVKTLAMLLQKPDGASKGRRFQVAQSLAVLVETEEHARLLAATGKHAAQPVVDLLKSGNLEEKVAAAGILTRVCKVRLPSVTPRWCTLITFIPPRQCTQFCPTVQIKELSYDAPHAMPYCNVGPRLATGRCAGSWALRCPL